MTSIEGKREKYGKTTAKQISVITRERLESAHKTIAKAYVRTMVSEARRHRMGFNPDYSLKSLQQLELLLDPPEKYREVVSVLSSRYHGVDYEISRWGAFEGLADYFGNTLVKNLGGQWQEPSDELIDNCSTEACVDSLHQNWLVIVGAQKVPVIELAGRRIESGPSESLVTAFQTIAEGRYTPSATHFKPSDLQPPKESAMMWFLKNSRIQGLLALTVIEVVVGLYLLGSTDSLALKGAGGTLIAFGIAVPLRAILRMSR